MNVGACSGIVGEKTDRIEWAARWSEGRKEGRKEGIAKKHEAAGSYSAVTVADGQVGDEGPRLSGA